ncbi:MAG: TraR/DksA family transcriptional regulator [Candidatus Aminicenantes bacterium]|nr:TraR/DksA family transcriptional regulator [Candidatus Aminicenantes bacterium]
MEKSEKIRHEKLLLERKKELIESLSEIVQTSRELDPGIAQDIGDKAESSYTKEFLLSLSDTEREQLVMIDEALKRLAAGRFGVCEDCGKEVSKKRLSALPWTPLCIECRQKHEAAQ